MTTYPNSPKLIKGGIVLLDPDTAQVKDVISLQYNPESMTRSFQIQGVESGESGDRSQALRLKGPPVESYKLDAELDATDLLEKQTAKRRPSACIVNWLSSSHSYIHLVNRFLAMIRWLHLAHLKYCQWKRP